MNTFPIFSTLISIIILTIISIICLYDSKNLLSNNTTQRNTQPIFQKIQNEHLSVIDSFTTKRFNYLKRLFLILLPEDHQVPDYLSKPVTLTNKVEDDAEYLRVIFTGNSNEEYEGNIFKQTLMDQKLKQDNIFYQIQRNNSFSQLITKDLKKWENIFYQKEIYKKQEINSDKNIINYIIQELENEEQFKVLIVCDIRDLKDQEQLNKLHKYLKIRDHKFLMLQKINQNNNIHLYSNNLYSFDQQLELTDLNPTIQALIGSGLNFNNMGMISKDILDSFDLQDTSQQSLYLYNNAYQLMTLFLSRYSNSYFKNDYLEQQFEKISEEFDLLKEYFMTYIFLTGEELNKEDSIKTIESVAKFYGYCKNFQNTLTKVLTHKNSSKWNLNFYLYMVLQITTIILMALVTVRSFCFILEDEEEIRIKLMQYLILIEIAAFLYLVYHNVSWYYSSLALIVISMVHGFISSHQVFKGEIADQNIHYIDRVAVSGLIVIGTLIVQRFINTAKFEYSLMVIIITMVIIQGTQQTLFKQQTVALQFTLLFAFWFVSPNQNDYPYQLRNNSQILVYLPILGFIIFQELILHSKIILYFVDKKKHILTIFRVKNVLCFMLVPRLWLGDFSQVLKSTLFQFYQFFFISTTVMIAALIITEALNNLINRTYKHLINLEKAAKYESFDYSFYFIRRQIKFEMTLLFILNLMPALLLLNGKENILILFLLITVLSFIANLIANKNQIYRWIFIGQMMIVSILFKSFIVNRISYEIQQEDPFIGGFLSILKSSTVEIIVFSWLVMHSLLYSNANRNERNVSKCLDFDRLYESEQDIQNQLLFNQVCSKMGLYIMIQQVSQFILQLMTNDYNMEQLSKIRANMHMSDQISSMILMAVFLLF